MGGKLDLLLGLRQLKKKFKGKKRRRGTAKILTTHVCTGKVVLDRNPVPDTIIKWENAGLDTSGFDRCALFWTASEGNKREFQRDRSDTRKAQGEVLALKWRSYGVLNAAGKKLGALKSTSERR